MKKILHITNWYPNKWDNIEGIFIKEQYKVFSKVSKANLLHIQVREGDNWFSFEKINYSENETGYFIITRIKMNRVIEILSTLLLIWALIKHKAFKYDLMHFHIAYPLLTYYNCWKKIIKTPIIISEHWSAYHYNFYLPKETKKLERVKNIFRQKIPLITVSKALLNDIQNFAGTKDFPSAVIPNIIDLQHFRYKNNPLNEVPTFFIVNVWRSIKNPFPMLEAFANLASCNKAFKLNIGGFGPLLEEMKRFVKEKGLKSQVSFLGKLNKEEIADALALSDAYLYSSDYETFSVACAQALASGCPLIGPPIPAIMEYSDSAERVNVENNNAKEWEEALVFFINNYKKFNRAEISKKAHKRFNTDHIRSLYLDFLQNIRR